MNIPSSLEPRLNEGKKEVLRHKLELMSGFYPVNKREILKVSEQEKIHHQSKALVKINLIVTSRMDCRTKTTQSRETIYLLTTATTSV